MHSASRSDGTPEARALGGGGIFSCLRMSTWSGAPSNGSSPVRAS